MTHERLFTGPRYLHAWQVVCAGCRGSIRAREPVFLVEEMAPDLDEAYVHLECVRAYLELEDTDGCP